MAKNHDVRVRLSDEELQKIKRKAEELGMQVSSFLRFVALKSKVEVV